MFLSGLVIQGRKETIVLFLALLIISLGESTDSRGEESKEMEWGDECTTFGSEEFLSGKHSSCVRPHGKSSAYVQSIASLRCSQVALSPHVSPVATVLAALGMRELGRTTPSCASEMLSPEH